MECPLPTPYVARLPTTTISRFSASVQIASYTSCVQSVCNFVTMGATSVWLYRQGVSEGEPAAPPSSEPTLHQGELPGMTLF